MGTRVAPRASVEPRPPQPDEILHLLCHCQLDDAWQPTTSPLVAYCGWEDDELADWDGVDPSQICAMCIDADRCPRCGEQKPVV